MLGSADLIAKLHGQSVEVVERQMVGLEGHGDVLALSCSNAALCWCNGEDTQSAVVMGSCRI